MNKAYLFALAGLLAAAAPALAHPPVPATATFSSERGVPFGLVLDGRPLTRGAARQVHVDRLVPGPHWADFTVPTAYGGAVRLRRRVWLEPGFETSFVLLARPGWPLELRQVGAVALYGPACGPRAGYNDYAGYDADGDEDRGDGYGQNRYDRPRAPSGRGGYGLGSPAGAGYYPGSAASGYRTLSPLDADALIDAVQRRPFEDDKLSLAQEALRQRSIGASDLRRLLQSLEFEPSRIALAEFAYPHVADPQNFDRVYDAFDLEASAREVQQALAAAPPQY